MHFCNFVFLYILSAHDQHIRMAQLAILGPDRQDRQQISTDQKFIPAEKVFAKGTRAKPKQYDRNIVTFVTLGWRPKWETGNISCLQ